VTTTPFVGFKLTDNRLPAIAAKARAQADQLVEVTAQHIVTHMKTSMAEEKHGEMYGTHQASAPGEAPAIDTGHLVNSIQIERTGQAQRTITVGVDYGLALEMGTRNMAARPSMRPALEKEAPTFRAAVGRLVDSTR
jgi:HK97 gp10 family phage protein